MTEAVRSRNSVFVDIWNSYRSLPGWVQIWVAFWLVPVNMASLFFLDEPMGIWIAFLANIAMIPNLPIMVYERGLSKLMALPHIVPWTILVLLVIFAHPPATGIHAVYIWLLAATNTISLLFDVKDAIGWFGGDRGVAGRNRTTKEGKG